MSPSEQENMQYNTVGMWTIMNTCSWIKYKTHTFNCPLSKTTRVSRYQKGNTNLDLTEAGDSEWQWHQLGHMQVCTLLQSAPHHLVLLQAGCPCCPTNSVRALNQVQNICDIQVRAQLCLTITMSLCRYNEKTSVSSSICKNALVQQSLSRQYTIWCVLLQQLQGSLVLVDEH